MSHIYVFKRTIHDKDFSYLQYFACRLEDYESYWAMLEQLEVDRKCDEEFTGLIITDIECIGCVNDNAKSRFIEYAT